MPVGKISVEKLMLEPSEGCQPSEGLNQRLTSLQQSSWLLYLFLN
jgi:hypothetical protein